ncbi:MAG TPA: DUF5063 domain-containing protein [Bacteroidales bacterium]|nr:DUF5063 domain-containing protein [Bacteroidales bacterium]
MKNLHDLVYSEDVLDFVKQVGHFSVLVTGDTVTERKNFVIELLKVLPAMYSSMLRIQVGEPFYNAGNEKFVSEEDWSTIYQRVLSITGSQNEYLGIPDDDEYDRMDLISREISEDVADIYQDVRDFIELYRNGTEEIMNDALWECRMNFESYWGKKLLRVCGALHNIMLMDEDALGRMDQEWEEKHGGKEINTDEWFISKRQKDLGGDSDI